MSLENAIVIKNYNPVDYPAEYLYAHDDWDLVEFNFNINSSLLQQWYNELLIDFKENIFAFNEFQERLNVEKSKEMVEQGYCGVYCGPIDAITLAWPKERYEPLPPPSQCNPDMFPEVVKDTFINDALLLGKYNKGYFNTMVNAMGKDAFRQAIVVRHHPTMKILQHQDTPDCLKLHIPVSTNKDAVFKFGENAEREYHLKEGKAYLLNTGIWHGTANLSTTDYRIHIITRITREHLSYTLGLTGTV